MDCPTGPASAPWILLIHQIPPKPDYLRVKVRRQLNRIGAVAVKNSVYVLPRGEQCMEDFQWVLREIAGVGGKGAICEATFVDGLSTPEVEALFQVDRDADYRGVADEAATLDADVAADEDVAQRHAELRSSLARLTRRFEEVAAIDFFGAPERARAEQAVRRLESRLREAASLPPHEETTMDERPRARTWVTRKGVKVDRIASAWLIRRFIDSAATFRFVMEREHDPRAGELRFDMYEGEFTHEGDRCSFEVLLQRFGLHDSGLVAIAEIVHDLDLKDSKYGRPETPGVARMISGIVAGHARDEDRLPRGFAFLEDLYTSFREEQPAGGNP